MADTGCQNNQQKPVTEPPVSEPPVTELPVLEPPVQPHVRCPRCESDNTKFCYYNNYSLSQPRYNCKSCKRFWTHGGRLRNVPVGGSKRPKRVKLNADSGIIDPVPIPIEIQNLFFMDSPMITNPGHHQQVMANSDNFWAHIYYNSIGRPMI